MIFSRIYFLMILIGVCATQLTAQTEQKLKIESATVFLSGAELESRATLNLSKGENDVIFTNVAGDVNSESLTVNATNGVVVQAVVFQNNYLTQETISPDATAIKDSIELLKDAKSQIENKIEVINEQTAILQANRKVGGDNTGLSVAELTKMLDLVGVRMDACLAQKMKEENQLKKLNDRLNRLKKQLEEEQKKGYVPGGVLKVKFYAKEATNSTIVIDYIVPDAGWLPTYDIFADDANSPVKLFYKANIHQNTGVNWNNVHLSLSTGNPNEGVQAPVLSPLYLAFYVPPPASAGRNMSSANREVTITAFKKPLINRYEMAPMAPTSINDYVAVDNSGINTTFDIDLPYTIPTDGQEHLVAIKRYELPASFRHFAVPKVDKDVFLEAQITRWEDLNLLPGKTNIFYEGTYVGQGDIDVRNLKDTLPISLGRDKKIVVKRERDTKLRSVKTIGTNIRETFAYSISIRNTRKEAINLVVQDQQPVSNDKDIALEDVDTGNSEFEPTTGLMTWTLTVLPNETKTLSFGFTAKYPKGKTVVNLK